MRRFIVVVLILGLCSGVLGAEDEVCQLRAERACRPYSVVDGFPGTLQDLRNDCVKVNKLKQCYADTVGNCSLGNAGDDSVDDRDRQRLKDIQGFIDVITQICDEDSELHWNFVPYLSCLKSSMEIEVEKQSCRDYSNKAFDFLRSRIQNKARMASGDDDGRDEVRREIMYCLRILFDMNCFIIQSMSACDSFVKEPILKIIETAGSLDVQCPVASRIDVIELLDALRLVSRQQIYVKDLILSDSFF